jgi:hypothetical protein
MAKCMFPRLGGKYLRSEASCQAGASSAIEEIAPPTSSCFGAIGLGKRKNEILPYTKRKFQLTGVQ